MRRSDLIVFRQHLAATSSPLMQVRSLQIANAYFAAYDHDQVTQKIDFQLVVPSLLIVLMHPNKVKKDLPVFLAFLLLLEFRGLLP